MRTLVTCDQAVFSPPRESCRNHGFVRGWTSQPRFWAATTGARSAGHVYVRSYSLTGRHGNAEWATKCEDAKAYQLHVGTPADLIKGPAARGFQETS